MLSTVYLLPSDFLCKVKDCSGLGKFMKLQESIPPLRPNTQLSDLCEELQFCSYLQENNNASCLQLLKKRKKKTLLNLLLTRAFDENQLLKRFQLAMPLLITEILHSMDSLETDLEKKMNYFLQNTDINFK